MNLRIKYPVYIISKGRNNNCLTANFFIRDKIDFKLVVEPQEEQLYREKYGDKVVILPFSNLEKGSTPARNWCWEDSIKNGYQRHWIFDDNIRNFYLLRNNKRTYCDGIPAITAVEDFTDRYINIGLSGFNYTMFVVPKATKKPFYLNRHLYSALLIKNDMTSRWRLKYNEDTDLNLQVLTNKLCIVSFNIFSVQKMKTMSMKGGNSDQLYKDDGRLKMARTLEKLWPEYVKVIWRFGRPQHSVNWKKFKHGLIRRTDIDWSKIKEKQYKFKLTKR